jgi:hypothetical protein
MTEDINFVMYVDFQRLSIVVTDPDIFVFGPKRFFLELLLGLKSWTIYQTMGFQSLKALNLKGLALI